MLGWLKRRPDPSKPEVTEFLKQMPLILGQYGGLLDKYPMAFIDETWLPVNKLTMKAVFKMAWLMYPEPRHRGAVERAWMSLSYFQPGIGDAPIDCQISPGRPAHEVIKIMEPYLRLSAAAKDSAAADRHEFKNFCTNLRRRFWQR